MADRKGCGVFESPHLTSPCGRGNPKARLLGVLRLPLDDYVAGLHACLGDFRPVRLGVVVLVALCSWWLYVPVHELSHAYGCILTGGTVTRLEIAPLYGAAWLQRFVPFVAVGSQYAGQLTDFDTYGNDWIYLATDAAPFLWTVLIGVPLLRAVRPDPRHPMRQCLMFGGALPLAFAPFISLSGDYYEMGSIVVSDAASLWLPSSIADRWRSDDIFRLLPTLSASQAGISLLDGIGVGMSLLLGTALAFGTYWLGTLVAGARARWSPG